MICYYFCPVWELYVNFSHGVSWRKKFAIVLRFIYLFFVTGTFGVTSKKPLSSLSLWISTPMFLFKHFTILGLTYGSVIHFLLILGYGMRQHSKFIILNVTD